MSKKVELTTTDEPALEVDLIAPQIPIAKLIDLRKKGLELEEIGAIVGCTKQNVQQRIKQYVQSVDYLQIIKDNRADHLTITNDKVLNELTGRDLKEVGERDLAVVYGVLYDKERLERDKSTANIVHVHAGITAKISDLEKRIAENRALLGEMPEEGEDDI